MKKTALFNKHVALNAKMVPFAGFEMPIQYTNIQDEHLCVRQKVGVFDVSHMGEFIIRGKEALDLVQYITSNDASKLKIGQAQYSCLPNSGGGIVDDLIVYRLAEDQCAEGENAFMLVVNASNIQKDWDWIAQHNTFDTRVIDISDHTALLAIQGPKAIDILQKLTEVELSSIPFYHFQKGTVAGISNVLISATGYTGAGGFELYVANEHAASLWDAVFEAGQADGIQAAGLGARDTLRLEMGYCLYGNDLNDETSPIEAGLGWITKIKKASDFIAKDIFIQQKAEGTQDTLVGFTLDGRRIPRNGHTLVTADGLQVGQVTSGTFSPSLGIPIGMGYLNKKIKTEGQAVFIDFGRKQEQIKLQKFPFLKKV